MKQTIKLAVIGAVLAAASSSFAQTTATAQSLTVKLTGYVATSETTATKVRIGNKEIFNEISDELNFEPKSKSYMYVLTIDGQPTVYVKNVFNKVTTWTDVGTYLSSSFGPQVNSLKVSGNSVKGTVYSIDQFTLSAPNFGDMQLQGFTTTKVPGYSSTSDVNGAGTTAIDGANIVAYGTISVGKVEKSAVILP